MRKFVFTLKIKFILTFGTCAVLTAAAALLAMVGLSHAGPDATSSDAAHVADSSRRPGCG